MSPIDATATDVRADASPVTIGVMVTPEAAGQIVEAARLAERQGFDFLACGEHVLFHVASPNAFVALAAAAAATRRIRLLSALTIAPLYPAGLLAKMATTVDVISDGRFDLGIGVGGEYPPEFAACGVPVSQRGARTDETLEICAQLFAGDAVRFDGRFAQIEDQRLAPRPVQAGGPPLWIGGRSAAAMRRAGRYGRYWFPYMTSPARLRDGLVQVARAAADAGRESPDGAVFAWAAVDPDPGRARAVALDTLRRTYHQDFTALADRYVPTGTPEQVTQRLLEYVEAGARAILFSPACPAYELPAMTELFAEEVMPRLRERTSALTATREIER